MRGQIAIQNFLIRAFEEQKKKNSRISQRAFAKKLGISQGAMSELLDGKRIISLKLATKILDKLGVDPAEKHEILKLFPKKETLNLHVRTEDEKRLGIPFVTLDEEQFKGISHWLHYAILSLVKTEQFQSDPKWIAAHFGVNVSQVDAALEKLLALKLLKQYSNGKLARVDQRIKTTDDVPSKTIRSVHQETLDLAKEKIEQVPVELRDFTFSTFPTNPALLPEAKILVRKFNDDLADLLGKEKADSVYRLSVQLFPLSRF